MINCVVGTTSTEVVQEVVVVGIDTVLCNKLALADLLERDN